MLLVSSSDEEGEREREEREEEENEDRESVLDRAVRGLDPEITRTW